MHINKFHKKMKQQMKPISFHGIHKKKNLREIQNLMNIIINDVLRAI